MADGRNSFDATRRIARIVADTLEKRGADLEYVLAHIPEDLDARFAGVDVKLAELRELILLQNSRFTKLEARFTELAGKVDAQGSKLDEVLARLPKP